MSLRFTKMQGLGNDFVVVDATRSTFDPTVDQLVHLTDRRFGVGCDQVLVVDPPPSGNVDFGYRIYNPDGSQVGQCGNGARCLARFVREHGLTDQSVLRLKTQTSLLELLVLDDGRVRVNMGTPRFEPDAIPIRAGSAAISHTVLLDDGFPLTGAALSMGNPHFVMQVDDVETAPLASVGEALQTHANFPQRVNVGFIQIIDLSNARLRVYERGAGETLACGSGACAAMVAGRIWGLLDATTQIHVRGGTLELQWAGDSIVSTDPVWMTGPAETVYEGSMAWPM